MISALCALLSVVLAGTPAPAPKDMLMAKMMLVEIVQEGQLNRSETLQDHGQCRRFQVDAFAEVAGGYMLASSPGTPLYMPLQHVETDASGRPIGVCWNMPSPSTGNAFVEVARYDFSSSRTAKENIEAARAFLENVRAGDLLQMVGTYASGGRGTHTVLFTHPYDPRTGMLYWSDSNFANKRVDGVRYGFARPYQSWPLTDVAGWISAESGNGATLYRLSEDVVEKK